VERRLQALRWALQDDDPRVREAAAAALDRAEHLVSPERLRALVRTEPDKGRRLAALYTLGTLRDRGAAGLLQELVFSDEDDDVRVAALKSLAGAAGTDAVETLAQALASDSPYVAAAAAQALGELGARDAVEALQTALGNEHRAVAEAAALSLGLLREPSAVPALAVALARREESVRVAGAEALGRIASASATEPLATAARDESAEVRLAAVTALGMLEPLPGDADSAGNPA